MFTSSYIEQLVQPGIMLGDMLHLHNCCCVVKLEVGNISRRRATKYFMLEGLIGVWE
jgi:hypothetical protein